MAFAFWYFSCELFSAFPQPLCENRHKEKRERALESFPVRKHQQREFSSQKTSKAKGVSVVISCTVVLLSALLSALLSDVPVLSVW